MNNEILPAFNINAEFRYENPVSDDKDYQLELATKLVDTAMATVNQGRHLVGEEENPDGDVYMVKTGYRRIPAGALDEPDPPEGETRGTHIMEDPAFELAEIRANHAQDQLERRFISELRRLFSRTQTLIIEALMENWEQITGRQRQHVEEYRSLIDAEADDDAIEGRLATWYESDERRDAIDQAMMEDDAEWLAVFVAASMRASEAGWSLGHTELERLVSNPVQWNSIQNDALIRARRWSARKIADIDRTTARQVRRVILDGLAEGKNASQVAAALREKFDQFKGHRSATIARTEINQNMNWGNWKTGVSTELKRNIELWKFWVTIRDSRERDTHHRAHGQKKRANERFQVGAASLRFPGDNGPAEEVINCRCTMTWKKVRIKRPKF
jgi:hypothetical protein